MVHLNNFTTQITGAQNQGRTCTIVVRGSNKLVLEEAERSLHDALCVIRCLVKQNAILPGGGAPEIQVSQQLYAISEQLVGIDNYCFRGYAGALEVSYFYLQLIETDKKNHLIQTRNFLLKF